MKDLKRVIYKNLLVYLLSKSDNYLVSQGSGLNLLRMKFVVENFFIQE